MVRLPSTDSNVCFCPGPRIRLQPGGLILKILRKVSPFKPQLLQYLKYSCPNTYKISLLIDKIVGVLLILCAFFFLQTNYKHYSFFIFTFNNFNCIVNLYL